MSFEEVQRRLWEEIIFTQSRKNLESRMFGNLHVRFGVGGGVQLPALHHVGELNPCEESVEGSESSEHWLAFGQPIGGVELCER